MVTMNLSSENSSNQVNTSASELMKKLKFLEEDRVKSFKHWQYGDDEVCSITKMAEAGFYFCGDDTVKCFVCGKSLDGWENDDDPWKEHEKHAPRCYFVQLHLKEDDMTIEDFLNLAAEIIKSHATKNFQLKLAASQKRSDEVRDAIKNNQ